ncbi:MAG: hypothetical protein KGJ77_06505, partial [Acidobacteriota bacterium]|nr:hypothetical protein [Acidobacteriota bacterium]
RPVVATVALLAALVALEVDGYVGPDPHVLGASDVAAGVVAHDARGAQSKTSVGAGMLLAAARTAAHEGAGASGGRTGRWWYVDPGFGAYGFVYGEQGVWFSVLRGDPTQAEYEKITLQVAPHLLGAGSVDAVAAVIDRHFDPASGRVHVFVPSWLQAALVHRRAAWGRPGVLVAIPAPPG